MRARRLLLAATLALAAAWARPAAAGTALGLGADYLTDPEEGAFMLTLAPEARIARHLSVGGRFGAMLVTGPNRVGAPIDLRLRARFSGIYLDFLAGPWIVFKDDPAVRLHAAFGFGVLARDLSFGLEVGYLDPTPMIGVRLAFPLF
jgi:hypothetical protein